MMETTDLSLEFLRVVEQAAIASAHTMGLGDRHRSDQVAVEAMRRGAKNVFVWTDDGNRASAHGIERAGFEPVGRYHVTLWFAGLWRKVERLA